MERLPKEEVFNIIDEKLKPIRATLQENQQMDMETFYDIFTRSNELIYVVDCRSQEEYDECHISGAKTLETYRKIKQREGYYIRSFFYSRIGERSAKIVEEEVKKGMKAYNVDGGFIKWLHFNGFCDYADFNAKKVNVLDKEFAQYVPEKYNPVFRD